MSSEQRDIADGTLVVRTERRQGTHTIALCGELDLANAVFAPTGTEVDQAQAIIAAFSLPENAGKGAIQLDGRMVERLHAEIARRTLSIASGIAALTAG